MSTLKQFVVWLDCPIEEASNKKVLGFIDHLLDKKLKPKTINCYLDSIRSFYEYLREGEELEIANSEKRLWPAAFKAPSTLFKRRRSLKASAEARRPAGPGHVPAHAQVRSASRRRCIPHSGRAGSQTWESSAKPEVPIRMVYVSPDAHTALTCYLKERSQFKSKSVFLVERGLCKGKPISVRGIQKRMEYYAGISGLKVSCHHLRCPERNLI